MQSINRRICCVFIASIIVGILFPASGSLSKAGAQSIQLTPSQLQRLKEIRHRILESGVIESADVLQFHCQLPYESTILSIVADGTEVKQKDVLVKLDDSELKESISTQQIAAKQAEAALATAEADYKSAERLTAQALPVAELALETAKLEQQRRVGEGGEMTLMLRGMERNITAARKNLERLTEEGTEDSRRREAQQQLDEALAKKELFVRYIQPHETAALKLAVAQAELALREQQADAARAMREAEATFEAAKLAHEHEQTKLNKLGEQVQACEIIAPRDGVVMHAVATGRRNSNAFGAGATVRSGQLLVEMPNLEKLRARVFVNESQIARVKPGQSVTLQLDALPDRELVGEVTTVNRTPEPGNWLNSDVVEYAVLVRISDPTPALKIGMQVAAEIDLPVDD